MICYIFWNMDKIQFVPVPATKKNADEEDAVQLELVQSTDSKFEFQLRVWQQFMRVPTSSVRLSSETSAATSIDIQIDTHILT